MTIVVTGGAGFIGSNLVKAFNDNGYDDILVVDNLSSGNKFLNLVDCEIKDYIDKNDFLALLKSNQLSRIEAIFHQGACSDTMQHDGRYMMKNNYEYTVQLFEYAQSLKIPFLYASSAAVYGGSTQFFENRTIEKPLNVYGYSKFLFDQMLRRKITEGLKAPVVGFRYFNVYGDREQHKGRMASVAYHHFNQFQQEGQVKLFGRYAGYSAGCQMRDFVSVEDVVQVNLHFLDTSLLQSGVYNCGTGVAQTFNDVALTAVNTLREHQGLPALSLSQAVDAGVIHYVDFPDALKGKYQSYTQADLTNLRHAGYQKKFYSVQEGVARYLKRLLM